MKRANRPQVHCHPPTPRLPCRGSVVSSKYHEMSSSGSVTTASPAPSAATRGYGSAWTGRAPTACRSAGSCARRRAARGGGSEGARCSRGEASEHRQPGGVGVVTAHRTGDVVGGDVPVLLAGRGGAVRARAADRQTRSGIGGVGADVAVCPVCVRQADVQRCHEVLLIGMNRKNRKRSGGTEQPYQTGPADGVKDDDGEVSEGHDEVVAGVD